MKQKFTTAIAPEGCNSYLIAGKEYLIIGYHDKSKQNRLQDYFYIKSENDVVQYCIPKLCGHLNGKDWILK